jgi:hypothetical protein
MTQSLLVPRKLG